MDNNHHYYYNNHQQLWQQHPPQINQQQNFNHLWCLPEENEQQHSSSLSNSIPSSHNYYYSSFPGCSTPMASPVQRMEATSEIAPLPPSSFTQSENAFTPVPFMDEQMQHRESSNFLNNFNLSDQPQKLPLMSNTSIEWSSPSFSPQNPQQTFATFKPSIQSNFEEFKKLEIETSIHSQTPSITPTLQKIQQPNPQHLQQEQQQKLREQRRCLTSQNKVQQWQQFGQMPLQDSGVHSMSHSTAPSVMSSIHPASCMSAISSLPDEFPGLKEHPYFQNMPSSIRHEEPEKMRQVLPELIPLINDESEEIVLRALTILISIARKDKELCLIRSQFDGPLIGEKRVVEELLRTLRTHKKNKKVACYVLRALHFISDNEPSGRELFVKTLNAHGTDCLEELVHCIGIQEHSCFKYAFLVLHNLMTDIHIGRKVIAYMCEMKILTKVLCWLSDKNEKFLNIVTDIVNMLINKNSEQMSFFLGLNGHQKLINILANSQQEPLLYRAVKLLNKVVHLDPNKIVAAGLLEAAQKHLDQASQRLLRQLFDCIRAISHVPSEDHKINNLLQKLLQLLGTNDMRLKESCADILANLSANNAKNKEFLVEKGAVFGLFQLLYEMNALDEALGGNTQRHNIQERALSLLRSLSSGNDFSGKAKQQIITKEIHKQILLEKMRNKQRNWPLLRRTLMLLQYIAQEGNINLLTEFNFSINFSPNFPQLPDAPLLRQSKQCSFVSQTVLLLTEGLNSLPESWELCQRCMDLLKLLTCDEGLLKEIFNQLSARWIKLDENQPKLLAPQLILRFFDQLSPTSLALIAKLVYIPEAALMIGKDKQTLDSLYRWMSNNNDINSARLASQILQMIELANNNKEQKQQKQLNFSGRKMQQQFTFGEESCKLLTTNTEMEDFSSLVTTPSSSNIATNCAANNNFTLQPNTEQLSNSHRQQQSNNNNDCLTTLSFDSDDVNNSLSDFANLVSTFCPSSSPISWDVDY